MQQSQAALGQRLGLTLPTAQPTFGNYQSNGVSRLTSLLANRPQGQAYPPATMGQGQGPHWLAVPARAKRLYQPLGPPAASAVANSLDQGVPGVPIDATSLRHNRRLQGRLSHSESSPLMGNPLIARLLAALQGQ